jgi:hypothetical protein
VSGTVPESIFSLKSTDLNNKQLPIPFGTPPLNRFLLRLIFLKLFNTSIPLGISLSNKLPDKSSELNPFKPQIPAGKDPEN